MSTPRRHADLFALDCNVWYRHNKPGCWSADVRVEITINPIGAALVRLICAKCGSLRIEDVLKVDP
jgi:hypothetical protein